MNIDLDEIRPDRFVIHNDKIRPLLKGEGVTVGKFFELGTWRRDGLIARLRERTFNVRTIDDRIAGLGAIEPQPLGGEGMRVLSQAKERIATFDREELRWRDVPMEQVDGQSIVRLRAGQALRRRKSRGKGDYYLATLSGQSEINLLPVGETQAVLYGYAEISLDGPVVLHYSATAETTHLAQRTIVLPPPHQSVLELLTLQGPPWTFPATALPLATEIFARLGVTLQPQP